MKKYILSEAELYELLMAQVQLECLQEAGVDNWSWYMYNRDDFLAERMNKTPDEIAEEEIGFGDWANELMRYYQQLK